MPDVYDPVMFFTDPRAHPLDDCHLITLSSIVRKFLIVGFVSANWNRMFES